MAAVLACGAGAQLSDQAASYHFGLTRGPAPPPEVTALTERRVPGVITRRARAGLHQGTVWRGIPVVSVAQTLVDLAAVLDEDQLARACHEAGVRHRTTPAQVELVLGRRPAARGAASLRRILRGDAPVTLSELERGFLRLLERDDLPRPQTNKRAGSFIVDCRWPELRVTVELDSYRYHQSRHAWERDRRPSSSLMASFKIM